MEKLTFFGRKTMTPPMEAAEDIRRSSLLFHHYKEDDVSQTLGQLLERVGDASGADHQVLELDELTGTPDTSPKPGGGIPFVLAFTDLTYSVKTSKKLSLFLNRGRCRTGPLAGGAAENPSPNTKTLLESISGEARNGEILAVLGASGSGKSTLIDALANRIAKDSLKGSVTLNGEALESKLLRAISAYVMQDDLLYPMLTVEETLVFSAEFRLPRALSKAKKKGRVEMLIDQLGLRRAANTIIGDEGHRGVSGGERRRVSIGIDIIHDPIILFLDEPTSGLDSSSAYMVIKVLQRIAHSGSIVIMSIHQPSYRKNRILKRVLRSDREKESAPAVSAHSHTGAALEVIPATVETIIRAMEEEPASKKPQTEEETAVEVFKPSDAAFKLFKGKGVIDPRLSKEATNLSELSFVPGDDSTRHPNPLMRKFHISSSQSLDAAGGQRLVDTLMDFSGAEKALGAGVSASDGSRREQGIDNQVEISPAVQGEDETCSPHVVERVDEPVMVEESREREAIEIVKAVPVPLLMITTAGEAEDIVPLDDGDEGPAVAIVSEPFWTGGEDLPASVPGEGTLAPPSSGFHGTVPPKSPPRDQSSMVNIEYIVEKILMKKLSNNWSLDGHRKRIDDTVARSMENKEAIERFSQSLTAVEKTVAAMQESITDLWECGAGQDVIYTRMRGEIATVSTGQELALEQIRDLQNMIEKTTEDISTNEAEKKKFMLNHSSFLEKHDIEHRAVNAMLGSLEELRRYANMSRGLEQTAEYSSAFMAGF